MQLRVVGEAARKEADQYLPLFACSLSQSHSTHVALTASCLSRRDPVTAYEFLSMESSTDMRRSLSPSTRTAKRLRIEGDDDANKTADASDEATEAFCQTVKERGFFAGEYSDFNATLHLAGAVQIAIKMKFLLNETYRDNDDTKKILSQDETLANLVRRLFNNGDPREILYHRSSARLSTMNISKLTLSAQLLFSYLGQVRILQFRNNMN
jgi:hypothetical protein